MKKTIFVFFLIMTGLYLFAQNTNQGPGLIRELNGTVELKAPGASAYVPAKSGDSVSQDTIISTGFKSTALVEIGSTVIAVRPLTRLTLTEIRASAGTETLNVNLQAGRVRVDVNPPSGTKTAMSVSSPVATASVRGTGFEMDSMNLNVDKGSVDFSGKRGVKRPVKAGFKSHIEGNGKALDPVGAKTAELVPKAPVGSDRGRGGRDSSSSTNGIVTLRLNYGNSDETGRTLK